jgi:molecular chaperone IbpA
VLQCSGEAATLFLLKKERKMNALARFDTTALNQLNRALVGFDRIFNDMESKYSNQTNQNYPPFNIVKIGDNLYDIVVAVAGFEKKEITVEVDQDQLIVRGEKDSGEDAELEYLHRGLALRDFERRFTLAEHIEVIKAEIKNGLLVVKLERKVPEALLPRKIEINQID